MKGVIFGSGKAGQYLFDEIQLHAKSIEIVGFWDNYASGSYKDISIKKPGELFREGESADTVFIAAGSQKAVKIMINFCRNHGIENIYMLHDIAGKCHMPLFVKQDVFDNARVRKLRFSSEKPSLHYIEVPITEECNLNCKGCLFTCNLSGNIGHVSFEQVKKDADRMCQLFYDVPWIRILGGEPLMHPDIIEILDGYREKFPDSEIDVCTNGLLIPKMKEEFWECMKKNNITIHVSGYKPTRSMINKIDEVIKKHDMPYVILNRDKFLKYYTLKPENDMRKSYEKCIASGCYELYCGKMSTCSGVIAFEKLNNMFGCKYKVRENEDWIDIHNENLDGFAVKEFLERPSYCCKYCDFDRIEEFEWDYASINPDISEHVIDYEVNP